MRTSSAERDSTSASSRLWRISTLNQLSMPLFRNCTAKKYTSRIGSVASTPKIHTMRALSREPMTWPRQSRISCVSFVPSRPDQHDEARDVDHQDPRMQPAELLRVLRGLRHEQDGRKPQQAAETHDHRRGGAFQGRSVHVFQSLSALQSSVQNSSQPKTSGAVFISSTARMRPS